MRFVNVIFLEIAICGYWLFSLSLSVPEFQGEPEFISVAKCKEAIKHVSRPLKLKSFEKNEK